MKVALRKLLTDKTVRNKSKLTSLVLSNTSSMMAWGGV